MSVLIPYMNLLQSQIWPGALDYIHFTLLGYTLNKYACHITHVCCTELIMYSTCMYICMYVWICNVCMCVCYVYVCYFMGISILVYMQIFMYVCRQTCMNVCVYWCTYVSMYEDRQVWKPVCISHALVSTYVCMYLSSECLQYLLHMLLPSMGQQQICLSICYIYKLVHMHIPCNYIHIYIYLIWTHCNQQCD